MGGAATTTATAAAAAAMPTAAMPPPPPLPLSTERRVRACGSSASRTAVAVAAVVVVVLLASGIVSQRGASAGAGGAASRGGAAPPAAQPAEGEHDAWDQGGTDDSSSSSSSRPSNYRPCDGDALRCRVVNPVPLPGEDFRGVPRRAEARRGMVAADSSRCSEVGRDALARGGNAVDAAVAAALCGGVVSPVSSGLGGGAFITVRLANGSAFFVDARETAPRAAHAKMYEGLPPLASLVGPSAVAVPGELPGLYEAWRRWGRRPWAELVLPAARLAREGFATHPYLAYALSGPYTLKLLQSNPELREAFLVPRTDGGGGGWRAPVVGELCCKRPALAATLEKIAQHGGGYLTSAPVAAAMADELRRRGGILTAEDFAGARPVVREPLRAPLGGGGDDDDGDLEMLLPPPPSSAAVVGFALKLLAGYNDTLLAYGGGSSGGDGDGARRHLRGKKRRPQPPLAAFGGAGGAPRDGGVGLQRLVEALKHGFAVRTALGDPGTPEAPSPHAAAIEAAAADLLDGAPGGFVDRMRRAVRDDGVLPDEAYGGRWNPKGVAPPEEHGTSHLCVVDAEGNAVALTTSINAPFGSGVVLTGTGILLGDTMDDFARPGRSSRVAPHPNEANFIAPGRRPLSAMSPIIVYSRRTGRPVALAGASGGPLIVSATVQTLARLLLEGADAADAVDRPRLHDQLLPTSNTLAERVVWGETSHELPPEANATLTARGQVVQPVKFSLGVSQAIFVRPDGTKVGYSDSRKDGAPLGL